MSGEEGRGNIEIMMYAVSSVVPVEREREKNGERLKSIKKKKKIFFLYYH